MLLRFRATAMKSDERRPWDGVDGQDFEEYVNREQLGLGGALPHELMTVGSGGGEAGGGDGGEEEEEEEKDEFDWEGTDKIQKFMNERYKAFLTEQRPFALRNPWNEGDDDDDEQEEEVRFGFLSLRSLEMPFFGRCPYVRALGLIDSSLLFTFTLPVRYNINHTVPHTRINVAAISPFA